MILKETSFTKNVTTNGASTPDFTQDIGQNKAYYMDYQGFAEICVAMLYYQVYDYKNITAPLGKGGKRQSLDNMDNYSLELASIFDNIYINGIHLKNESFIMFVIKEERETHHGRRQLKFSRDARYNDNTINESCIQAISKALGCTENGSWIVTEMNIGREPDSRPRLEFSAIVVDEEKPRDFKSIQERSQFIKSIKPSYFESSGFNAYHEDQTKPLQLIFYGAPGTGKSHTIKCEVDDKGMPCERTTFHPDSDYSTFVGAYKPTTVDETVMTVIGTKAVPVENPDGQLRIESKIVYEFVPQAFLKAYTGAWKDQSKDFYLIIEEINRGNCAQIFGDLFQLLDRNDETGRSKYPISPDHDIEKFLQTDKEYGFAALTDEQKAAMPKEVLNGERLVLPQNLHIWATMNTSDQSLFPIDSAFKRRWDWQYIPISNANKGWMIKVNGKKYDWWDFLEKMNEQINTTTNSEDKKMGYFFCKAKDGVIDAKTFVGKVVFYVWNDVFKDFANEADCLFKDEDGTLLSFNKFYRVVNGKTEVLEGKVEQFMTNLGLEPMEEGIE